MIDSTSRPIRTLAFSSAKRTDGYSIATAVPLFDQETER
jgi:hypothetical protein